MVLLGMMLFVGAGMLVFGILLPDRYQRILDIASMGLIVLGVGALIKACIGG